MGKRISLVALLCVALSGAQAETLARWNQYWEDNSPAWQDAHQYEKWEHKYFADEHRWQGEEDRKAWFEAYQDIAATALATYEQTLAQIAADDSLLDTQAIALPVRRSRDMTVYPRYGAKDLAGLHADDEQMLAQLVDVLKDKQNVKIMVRGHTNNVALSASAAAAYTDNKGLSLARARSVGDFLRGKIDHADFAIDGLGSSEAIASNSTADGRSRNRRVEILVSYDTTSALTMDSGGEIPADFRPWWQTKVMSPLTGSKNTLKDSVEGLYYRALNHSTQIKVFEDVPLIRETAILEAEGDFDPRVFMEAEYRNTNEPVGSTLRTGGPSRFKEDEWNYAAGLRKKVVTGGEIELSQRLTGKDNNSVFFQPDDQALTRLRLSFTQPLLRAGGINYNRSTVAISKVDHSIALDELQRQVESHLLEISQAYWSLYLERSNLLIKQRLSARGQQLLDELRERRGVDVLESQIAAARAALAVRQADGVRASQAIRNAEARIVSLVNDPELRQMLDFELIPALAPIAQTDFPDIKTASKHALYNRPEINQGMKQLRAGMIRAEISENELLPELDLIAGVELNGLKDDYRTGGALRNQFDDGDGSYFVGLQFEMPIGNREAKARYQRRRLEVRQLTNQLRTTINTMMLETQVSVREVHTAKREAGARYQSMVAAQAELDALEQRRSLAVGNGEAASSYIDRLLTAQERLAESESGFANSQLTHALALTNLDRAMGVLMQTHEINVNRVQPDNDLPFIELSGKRGSANQ